MQRRQQEILVATIINHPALLHELAEDFAELDLTAPDLDKLRREILNIAAARPDLDAAALARHLSQDGFARAVDGLLSPQVYVHGAFARPDADIEGARCGWLHARHRFQQLPQHVAEIDRAAQGLARDMTEASWRNLTALQDLREDEDGSQGVPGGTAENGFR
jgi:DNA primase